jgi:hypothetical protein
MKSELAAINSALGACAALFKAQDADRDRQSQCAELDRGADAEHKRLDALGSWVESTLGPMIGEGRPAPGAAAAAAQILECARSAIATQRQALHSRRDETSARLSRPDSRALRNAVDLYFGHFELAGTRWSLRWQGGADGRPPSATAIAEAPGAIEAEYTIAVPQGAPWWQPTRLADLADPGAVKIAGPDGKPASPAKLWLAGVTWHMGSGTLLLSRSKRKLASPLLIAIPDGAPTIAAVGADGRTASPPRPLDRAAADYLETVWTRLSDAAEDLIEARGAPTSLSYDGTGLDELRSPAAMAGAMLGALGPALRRIREGHGDSPDVIEALRRKFADLPAAYRAAVERAGLGDPEELAAIDDEALTMPFAASRNDDIDIDDSLFGTSTVDELVDNLSLEGTLPGHVPAASRDATAPI